MVNKGGQEFNLTAYNETVTHSDDLPARITSISRNGLLTIEFKHLLFVPQFLKSTTIVSESNNSFVLKTNSPAPNMTLNQFIDETVLLI
jgi:hypothetical protein